jgi:hypothetical protein
MSCLRSTVLVYACFLSLAPVYASRYIGARRLSFFRAGSRGVTFQILKMLMRGNTVYTKVSDLINPLMGVGMNSCCMSCLTHLMSIVFYKYQLTVKDLRIL